jgi:hypothetical protein
MLQRVPLRMDLQLQRLLGAYRLVTHVTLESPIYICGLFSFSFFTLQILSLKSSHGFRDCGFVQTDLEKYLSSEVTCASTPPSHRKKCPYCSIDSPEYPPVKVKIMPVRGKKKDELSQVLSMEIGAKTDNVASDYWGFVELTSKSYDLDFAPPRQRDLLPFEVKNLFVFQKGRLQISLGNFVPWWLQFYS